MFSDKLVSGVEAFAPHSLNVAKISASTKTEKSASYHHNGILWRISFKFNLHVGEVWRTISYLCLFLTPLTEKV